MDCDKSCQPKPPKKKGQQLLPRTYPLAKVCCAVALLKTIEKRTWREPIYRVIRARLGEAHEKAVRKAYKVAK